ncbi:MAG TPA: DUF4292 domain-containing protein [Ignavibacteria bacterium]|nr:DUF4292 domain-containing protein [Ignavibacteria bacterium]
MKKIFSGFFITSLVLVLLSINGEKNTNSNLKADTIEYIESIGDSVQTDTSTATVTTDTLNSVNPEIIALINSVNEKSLLVDMIQAEGDVYVYMPKAEDKEANGQIEIRCKKPDEFWFRIWGSVGPISKDAFFGHFTRTKFLYYNNLNDYSIEGPTTDENMGAIIKVKCTFDDALNALTGSVKIPFDLKSDTLTLREEGNNNVVTITNLRYKRQYWINKNDNSISKYDYYIKANKTKISIDFSGYTSAGSGKYAKYVSMTSSKGEKMKITFKSYLPSRSYLNFSVDVPYDIVHKVWKK